MKPILLSLAFLFAIHGNVLAGKDKPITFDQLPENAKTLINTHFSGIEVSFAKKESDFLEKSYEVIFVNGNKIEFDKNGDWKEIDCKYTEVPEAVIPAAILKHVRATYGSVRVIDIDKNKRNYELELANGIELTFDKSFNLIDVDN